MNEKIKKLAHNAGYKHPDAVGMCEDYDYFDYVKFAELLIKDVLSEVYDEIQYTFSVGLANEIDERLKKLYGVEE